LIFQILFLVYKFCYFKKLFFCFAVCAFVKKVIFQALQFVHSQKSHFSGFAVLAFIPKAIIQALQFVHSQKKSFFGFCRFGIHAKSNISGFAVCACIQSRLIAVNIRSNRTYLSLFFVRM